MSAVTDIPKGLPKPIKPEDVRVGDKIRVVRFGVTIEGQVGAVGDDGDLYSTEGSFFLSEPGKDWPVYLLERPAPPEPKNLGAVVEESDGRRWTRTSHPDQPWVRHVVALDGGGHPFCTSTWSALTDPVVLHEGYVE